MNTVSISSPVLNDNKETVFQTPMNEDEFKQLFSEIFGDEVYKAGVEYLKTKKDPVVVDIGGNMGLSVTYFAPYASKIYALEPSSAYYPALVENTKHLPQVKTFKLGLSAASQFDHLFDNGSNGRPESFFGNGQVKETITTITLEKFMADQGIDHIDLLKVDCEGAEYIVFPSMGFINVASKIDFIIGEAHYFQDFMPGHLPMMLEDSGFKLTWLPINNMYKEINFRGDPKWIDKPYRLWLQTNFTAERTNDKAS